MHKHLIAAALICVPVAVLSWQGGMAAIDVTEPALQSQIERATRQKGDGLTLAMLGSKQLAAAKALSEPMQVALMKELGAAARVIVMAPAFLAAHEAYIAKEYKAANHGLKVKDPEEVGRKAMSEEGMGDLQLLVQRQMAAVYVQMAMQTKIEDLKSMFDVSLAEWTKEANKPKGSDKAKYTKVVAGAQAIKDLSATEPDKFRRGFAVLLSAANDGLDTEAAVFGAEERGKKEGEQLMWDKHNLRGALKRLLTQAVAEAPTVDFAAKTELKSGVQVFVNPAYEKKSLTWKAMYRAGKAPAAAGVEIARAWLKEL
jgi:hypothetical protein